MAKTERLQIRITLEMKEQLAELAAAENRTISNYIENLIATDIECKSEKYLEQARARSAAELSAAFNFLVSREITKQEKAGE